MDHQQVDVTSIHGIPFRVVYIPQGTASKNYPSVNTDRGPLVEFYDRRWAHTPDGQFVSRYYASTMLAHSSDGLCLHGEVSAWVVDAATVQLVVAWLRLNGSRTPLQS
jgi:hypothetical protein